MPSPYPSVPAPVPLAYQLAEGSVLCTVCLPPLEAHAMSDEGEHVGDVQPWTVDLNPGDDDLLCDVCCRVLLRAPRLDDPDE